jgi:hypothetical protein
MRIPGTVNYQVNPPAPVTQQVSGDDVTKEQMTEALRAWLPRDWGRDDLSTGSRGRRPREQLERMFAAVRRGRRTRSGGATRV